MKFIIILLLCTISSKIYSQNDSILFLDKGTQPIIENSSSCLTVPFLSSPTKYSFIPIPSTTLKYKFYDMNLKKGLYTPYYVSPLPLFKGDYSTGRHIWKNIYANGSQELLPGIGVFNRASIGFKHQLSHHIYFNINTEAVKINMPITGGTGLSIGGTFVYSPNERMNINIFGNYSINNSPLLFNNNYGASLSYDFSDHFGIEVGAQRFYNSVTGKWETIPMAIPYYKTGNIDLGIDVGGIIYEILRSVIINHRRKNNPMEIGIPQQTFR